MRAPLDGGLIPSAEDARTCVLGIIQSPANRSAHCPRRPGSGERAKTVRSCRIGKYWRRQRTKFVHAVAAATHTTDDATDLQGGLVVFAGVLPSTGSSAATTRTSKRPSSKRTARISPYEITQLDRFAGQVGHVNRPSQAHSRPRPSDWKVCVDCSAVPFTSFVQTTAMRRRETRVVICLQACWHCVRDGDARKARASEVPDRGRRIVVARVERAQG